MDDFASKDWLRPTPTMFHRLLRVLVDMLWLAAFLFLLAWAISMNEARAAGTLHMLENSMRPADGDECERATGKRPVYTISKQDRTNEPYHHRTCAT